MDNSSRNIVVFIATITLAALLFMVARDYAGSKHIEKPAEVAEMVVKAEPPIVETGEEPLDSAQADTQYQDEEIAEEDAEIVMGEPSVNLEQGGTPAYPPYPEQSETPVE